MSYETIRYSVADGVATIILARPDKLNAFNVSMKEELVDAFDRIDTDDAVRAVVITGDGKAFCAGADISSGPDGFVDGTVAQVRNPDGSFNYASEAARDVGGLLTLRIFKLTKPIIAAINGAAVGIGATMTLPMDIRLASEKARIGFVFARRGIVPEAASSWFLPRIAGISKALEWCCTGRLINADEALGGGLVSKVLPSEELLPAAYALAREIADNCAPVSVALTRQMMWHGLGLSHPMEAHRIDSRGVLARSHSLDAAEGVAAFLDKRAPIFPQAVSRDMPDYYPWRQEPDYF